MSKNESIALMASLMALGALTIDAILPALAPIAADLNIVGLSAQQSVITLVFVGMAFGLLIFGPLSDTIGRKPVVYIGLVIYISGSLLSLVSESYGLMIAGRIAQGVGASCCRIMTTTIIRDQFAGKQMGQVLSLVMIIFILVPALAPSLGQAILWIGSWRDIFGMFIGLAIISSIWFWQRQPETLTAANQRAFKPRVLLAGAKETLCQRQSLLYSLAAGATFGAFIGYLSGSQQILQVLYETGDHFPFYFGTLALTIGISSFLNAKLLKHYDMHKLCAVSLGAVIVFSLIFIFVIGSAATRPSLAALLSYLAACFFFLGTLLANFNALALEPLGHIAGVANSVLGSLQTFVSIAIGSLIGWAYDETVLPLTLGFLSCSLLAFLLLKLAASGRSNESEAGPHL